MVSRKQQRYFMLAVMAVVVLGSFYAARSLMGGAQFDHQMEHLPSEIAVRVPASKAPAVQPTEKIRPALIDYLWLRLIKVPICAS